MDDRIVETWNNGKEKWEMKNTKDAFSDEMYLQQYIMNKIALDYNLETSFTESRLISGLKINDSALKIKAISKIDSEKNKGVDKIHVSKGIMYDDKKTVVKGKNKYSAREVVIGESFAKENNIKLGDIVRINSDDYGDNFLVKNISETTHANKDLLNEIKKANNEHEKVKKLLSSNNYKDQIWFEVVGIGSFSDFVTPILDATSVMPNVKQEAMVYVDSSWMGYSTNLTTFINEDEGLEKNRYLGTYSVAAAQIVVASEIDREAYLSIKTQNETNDQLLKTLNTEYKEYAGIKLDNIYMTQMIHHIDMQQE